VVTHTELLRESAAANRIPVALAAVTDPAIDPQLPGGAELVAFTDAVLTGSDDAVAGTRSAVVARLGPDRMVEAAAVCACLQMMNRTTLAAGVPLSRARLAHTAAMRRDAGLDVFAHE